MKLLIAIFLVLQVWASNAQEETSIYFITANYCGYCMKMKNELFTSSTIEELKSHNISFHELNLNSKDPIEFMDSTFLYEPTGINQGQNAFFTTLFEGKSAIVPYIVIVKKNTIKGIAGYITKDEFESVINFKKIYKNSSTSQ